MAERNEFQKKLGKIFLYAKERGNWITLEEVEGFFDEEELSEEQFGLVCEYLLSQKIAVSGYVKTSAGEENEAVPLSAQEESYVHSYLRELEHTGDHTALTRYLPKVIDLAVELHTSEIFIGDMIQEGNVGLILALEELDGELDREKILDRVRAAMLSYVESQNETKRRDHKMVARVQELDDILQEMTAERGGKVDADEVAERLGVDEEELADILKLAGEKADE